VIDWLPEGRNLSYMDTTQPTTTQTPKETAMVRTNRPFTLRVTFTVFSKVLGKSFTNVELHRDMGDVTLRASALGWTVTKVEAL
jgi:hypothetical protein